MTIEYGRISTKAINRLILRDDVCTNCGEDATDRIGQYAVCNNKQCIKITKKITNDRANNPYKPKRKKKQ